MEKKFIIATKDEKVGYIKFGTNDVVYHRDLLSENEIACGGGIYNIDNNKKTIELSENSLEFGRPKFDNWEKLKIPTEFSGYKITYSYYKRRSRSIEIIDLTNLFTYEELD